MTKPWDLTGSGYIKSPYEEGYDAGSAGRGYGSCPYDFVHHSSQHRDWMRGHADGVRDCMKANPWSTGNNYWLGGDDTGPRYSL